MLFTDGSMMSLLLSLKLQQPAARTVIVLVVIIIKYCKYRVRCLVSCYKVLKTAITINH